MEALLSLRPCLGVSKLAVASDTTLLEPPSSVCMSTDFMLPRFLGNVEEGLAVPGGGRRLKTYSLILRSSLRWMCYKEFSLWRPVGPEREE